MIMSSPQRVSGEAFAIERLKDSPDLDYAALRAAAAEAGVSLQPIHYGRARKQLGLPALHAVRPPATKRVEVPPPAEERPTHEEPAPRTGGKKASVPFEFLVQELKREPDLEYAVLRDRAAAKGFKIAPIMYGRAKAVLGLVPVKPRAKKGGDAPPKPAVPRALKQVESVAASRFAKQLDSVRSLEQLVAIVRDLDAERRRLRSIIERVVTMLDEALDTDVG